MSRLLFNNFEMERRNHNSEKKKNQPKMINILLFFGTGVCLRIQHETENSMDKSKMQ